MRQKWFSPRPVRVVTQASPQYGCWQPCERVETRSVAHPTSPSLYPPLHRLRSAWWRRESSDERSSAITRNNGKPLKRCWGWGRNEWWTSLEKGKKEKEKESANASTLPRWLPCAVQRTPPLRCSVSPAVQRILSPLSSFGNRESAIPQDDFDDLLVPTLLVFVCRTDSDFYLPLSFHWIVT